MICYNKSRILSGYVDRDINFNMTIEKVTPSCRNYQSNINYIEWLYIVTKSGITYINAAYLQEYEWYLQIRERKGYEY
jgi:hypothetical protein